MDIRVAAYGVIVADQRILLAHWVEGGKSGWTLPGGGVDPGEDPTDAAIREILEETGYDARLGSLLGIDSIVIPARDRLNGTNDLHNLRIIYTAEIVAGSLRNEIGGTTDEARWFELAEVGALQTVDLVRIGLELRADPQTRS